MNDIHIRPARPQDAVLGGESLRLSLGSVAVLMFGAVPGHAMPDILVEMFSHPRGRFSHSHGLVAEWQGHAAGLLLAYPSAWLTRLNFQMGSYLLTRYGLVALLRMILPLKDYSPVKEVGKGEYYIGNLAVLPEFCRHGIGAGLLAAAEGQARRLGLTRCSLLVALDNDPARRLYEKCGYKVIHTTHITRSGGGEDGGHRMVKTLPG
ncbi:MAG: GNAT family N-acetyltransferase [Chloroflexi bacterium]|nr:GNAT family N-acetyltransferase [Chloroflexota bacterium]